MPDFMCDSCPRSSESRAKWAECETEIHESCTNDLLDVSHPRSREVEKSRKVEVEKRRRVEVEKDQRSVEE